MLDRMLVLMEEAVRTNGWEADMTQLFYFCLSFPSWPAAQGCGHQRAHTHYARCQSKGFQHTWDLCGSYRVLVVVLHPCCQKPELMNCCEHSTALTSPQIHLRAFSMLSTPFLSPWWDLLSFLHTPAPFHHPWILLFSTTGSWKKHLAPVCPTLAWECFSAHAVRRCQGVKLHKTATDGLWHPKLTRGIFIFSLPKLWNESLLVWQHSPRIALESCWRLRQMLAESKCWLCLLGSYSHSEEFSQPLWS